MEIKNDDGIGKMHYIGIALENIDDAKTIINILGNLIPLMDNLDYKYSSDVHTVIDTLHSIDNNYQAVCMTCRDVISMCPDHTGIHKWGFNN